MRSRAFLATIAGIVQVIAYEAAAAPTLGTPEEVLSDDVGIPYSEASNWNYVRVNRRHQDVAGTWGSWADIQLNPPSPATPLPRSAVMVDPTITDFTGTYQYRMQRCLLAYQNGYYCDPAWSNIVSLSVGPEC